MPKAKFIDLAAIEQANQSSAANRRRRWKATNVYEQVRKQFERRGSDAPVGTDGIVLARCTDNVYRMRLYAETRVAGNYLSHPMYIVERQYLDGKVQEDVLTHDEQVTTTWEWYGMSVVPSQSSEIIDFGRLDQAVQGLLTIMARVREGGEEISEAQANSIVSSRAAIREWQERMHREVAAADGQIEMLDKVYRSVFGAQE